MGPPSPFSPHHLLRSSGALELWSSGGGLEWHLNWPFHNQPNQAAEVFAVGLCAVLGTNDLELYQIMSTCFTCEPCVWVRLCWCTNTKGLGRPQPWQCAPLTSMRRAATCVFAQVSPGLDLCGRIFPRALHDVPSTIISAVLKKRATCFLFFLF